MRTLVSALGVQAPALYRRIGSKEALLALVLDHVMGDLTPPADGPWQEQLAELMRRLRALFARKPRLAALFAVSTPHGPNALRFVTAASAPLRRAGFSDAEASFAITALTTHVIGFTFLAASRASGPVHRQIALGHMQIGAAHTAGAHRDQELVGCGPGNVRRHAAHRCARHRAGAVHLPRGHRRRGRHGHHPTIRDQRPGIGVLCGADDPGRGARVFP